MKTYRITISNQADKDLKENIYYIKNILGNITVAKRLGNEVRTMIDHLSVMPYRNPIISREELKEMNVRIAHLRNYNFFYTIREDLERVEILRILHQRQNWIKILQNKDEADYKLLNEDPELYDVTGGVKDIITKSSADLRNSYSDISKIINIEGKIVRITQKGRDDMFAMSIDEYEHLSKAII